VVSGVERRVCISDRVICAAVLVGIIGYVLVEGIIVSPLLFLIPAFTVVLIVPIFVSRLPFETRRRRLMALFPHSVALNVRVDRAQVAVIPDLISRYGSFAWDRRGDLHMQLLATTDGLGFWTRHCGSEPVALVPWVLVGPFECGPSQRGLQTVIRITLSGVPSFGVGLMAPATYGIALSSQNKMRAGTLVLNDFRNEQIKAATEVSFQ
jgi:hypothetical protein